MSIESTMQDHSFRILNAFSMNIDSELTYEKVNSENFNQWIETEKSL